MISRSSAGLMTLVLLATSCTGDRPPSAHTELPVADSRLAAELGRVRGARLLFLHHSVGRDMLDGIEALDVDAGGGRIRRATLEDATASTGPMLAHFSGGRNGDPKSKMDAFAAALLAEPHVRFELAFMKLCYADFHPRTDVEPLFAHYEQTIAAIRRARPDIRLAHVTVPLRIQPRDIKSRIRRLLGLEVWEDAANARRAEFSERITRAFSGDAIFDLARVESTAPDGRQVTFDGERRSYAALYAGYTEDGGHLDASGRRVVGAAAIRFLTQALPPAAPSR